MPADQFAGSLHAFAARHHLVHHAHAQQFLGRVDARVQHHPFRNAGRNAPREKGVSAHAREQIEQYLREPEAAAFLGNDGLAAQRRFETAAERVALHDGDAVHAVLVEAGEVERHLDAELGVVEQTTALAATDMAGEQGKVATQVEDFRIGRQHEVVYAGARIVVGSESAADGLLPLFQLAEQTLREAGMVGAWRIGMHETPVAGGPGIVFVTHQGQAVFDLHTFDKRHGDTPTVGDRGRQRSLSHSEASVHPARFPTPGGRCRRPAGFDRQAVDLAASRNSRRRILPTFDFGNSSRNSTKRGCL